MTYLAGRRLVAAAVWFGATAPVLPRAANAQSYAVVGARWFDGAQFVARTMYVRDGYFVARRPARLDSVIDLSGKFVVAPYGEAHNHNIEGAPAATVAKYLRTGIFYVKDPESFGEARANAVGKLNTPTSVDAIFSGGGFTSPDGHPTGLARRNIARGVMQPGDDDGRFLYPIADSADLERRWPGFLAHRTDFVKVLLLYSEHHEQTKRDPAEFNWHGFDPRLLPLLVRRAHESRLPVTAHIETAADFRTAIAAGVDEIGHMPGFRPAHDSLGAYAGDLSRYRLAPADARLAATRRVTVITTLGQSIVFLSATAAPGLDSASKQAVLTLFRDNLRTLLAQRVRVVFGSDDYRGTTVEEVARVRTLGVFTDGELLRRWSVDTPRAIFPARRIGCFDAGCEASFLALTGDPLVDFANTQRIDTRMKNGRLLPPM